MYNEISLEPDGFPEGSGNTLRLEGNIATATFQYSIVWQLRMHTLGTGHGPYNSMLNHTPQTSGVASNDQYLGN